MPRVTRRRSTVEITCPACGSDKVQVVPRLEQFHEADVQGDFKDEITQCDACGEAIFTFEQAEAHSRAYAAAVARARNTLTPDRIFDLRMSIGWSQAKMEEAFGVGPKTWGRWERGTVAPSGPAARLLWIAEHDRSEFLRMVDAHTRKTQRNAKIVGSIAQQGPGEPAVGFRTTGPATHKAAGSADGSISSGNGGLV